VQGALKNRVLMLERFLESLCHEQALGAVPLKDNEQVRKLRIGDLEVEMKDLDPGFYFSAVVNPPAKERREEFFSHVMSANFLGQGTGGSALGLTEDESFLTLSLAMPYDMNYKTFKEAFEDFVNYLDYWKKEVVRFQTEGK